MMATCALVVSIAPDVTGTIRAAFRALAAAEMDATADEISARLVGSRRLVDVTVAAGTCAVRLAPFAELALREARAIAESTADPATKARRVREAVALAGF